MSERTVWTCDGCDEERVIDGTTDWKRITITSAGLVPLLPPHPPCISLHIRNSNRSGLGRFERA